jgi:predicted membrane-bound spermidine synthase
MFIEITTIQRFILVLGNTIYSISTVFFSLLLSSGIGSYYSGKINPGTNEHVRILSAIGGLSIIFGFISLRVHLILGLSYPLRVIITFFVVGPIGFLMGMPFPLGIRLLSQSNKEFVNWAWAINGCASVIGSILPLVIALYFGFSLVYIIAGIAYLSSITLILRADKTKFLD